jgi:hypothetical protein
VLSFLNLAGNGAHHGLISQGHTPRAKPVSSEIKIVRYSEPSSYRNDTASSYRGWLFLPVLWINFIVVCLFVINTTGIIGTLGWFGTPIVVRMLICICFAPFVVGFADSLVRRDFRCLWGMCYSAPLALRLMIWFTVWLPADATTRLSDLTWGNREGSSLDESSKALKRAKDGQRAALVLITCNAFVAFTVIFLMQFFSKTFPIFVMAYTLILSLTFALSLFDLFWRFLSCHHCFNSTSDDPFIEEVDQEEFNTAMDPDKLCMDNGTATPPMSDKEDGSEEGEGVYAQMDDDGVVEKKAPVGAFVSTIVLCFMRRISITRMSFLGS